MEARIAARLKPHEDAVAERARTATDAVEALRAQLAAMESRLAAEALERPASPGQDVEATEALITDRLASGLGAAGERIGRIEQGLTAIREHLLEFERNVAADNNEFEASLKSHEAVIQSARTAIGQTDDLVERVVEALESLQAAVLDQSEDRVTVPN